MGRGRVRVRVGFAASLAVASSGLYSSASAKSRHDLKPNLG